jgi:hypothetical protein
MSLLNKASLIQIPSGYKDGTLYSAKPTNGDGDFTFSRGSNLAATRVNSEGLIEKGRENVLRNSNAPNTHTTNLSTYSGSQADPFGGNTAWAWRETATTGQHYGLTANAETLGVGVWTFSVYVKPVNKTSVFFTWNSPNAGNYGATNFTFSSKTFSGSSIAEGYEELSNGWFRLYFAINVTSAGIWNVYYNQLGSYTGDVNNGYDFTRFQIERGLVATEYIETTTTTAQAGILEDMPRLDYSGGSCPSLLLEPQRSNLFTQSENFTSYWVSNGGTRTPNQSTSPDGGLNATEFLFNSYASGVYTPSFAAGTYTMSIFIKPVSGNGLIRMGLGLDNSKLNTSTLEITNQGTGNGSLIDYGNGWYRFITTITTSSSTSANIYNLNSNNVTAYIYGAMLEEGSYATSYIPTYGSSVTRSEDSCVKTGISSLIGQTEGTLFVEFETPDTNSYFIHSLSDGTNNNKAQIEYNSGSNTMATTIKSGGSLVASFSGSGFLPNTKYKVALCYKVNDFVLYANGSLIGSDTTGAVPLSMSILHIGSEVGNFYQAGLVNQVALFPTRLTNDELASLTTL